MELWEGEEGTGNLVFFQSGRDYDSQIVYDFLCASRSLLTLVLTSFIWMSFTYFVDMEMGGRQALGFC